MPVAVLRVADLAGRQDVDEHIAGQGPFVPLDSSQRRTPRLPR
jgi:hypothetical protein